MLIRTKLAPPHEVVSTLSRPSLVARVVQSHAHPLTLINAPAGYGKTTLLGQCFSHWRAKGALAGWYSVDDRRFESEQFFAYIMLALHSAGLSLPYSEQAITAGLSGIGETAAANALLAAMEASEEPVRLIIDDYHRIASPAVNAFMMHVIDRLPAHATIILSSRGDAALPIASLKAHGCLVYLDQTDLRFTNAEAAEFFEPGSSAAKWSDLVTDTEGWPAALQLLRIRGGSDIAQRTVSQLVGSSNDLAKYLAEQVFIGLPDDLQAFLLDVAWVNEVCGELADALTGRGDGHLQLDRLVRMNLLVTQVDERGGWYRFHPLLAEFIHGWLSRTRSERAPVVHERAARWYAKARMLTDALEHAARLPDPLAPLAILEEAKGWQLTLQGGLGLLRHVGELQLSHAERFPRVWLARCYMASHAGKAKEARALLDHIKTRLRFDDPGSSIDPGLRMEILTIEVVTLLYEGEPVPASIAEQIKTHLNAHAGDMLMDSLLRHLLCAIAYTEGEHALCEMHGEESLRGSRLSRMPFIEGYTHQYLGLSRLARGRAREAEISLRRAAEGATRHFGDGSAPLENTRVLLARAHYLLGETEQAKTLLDGATPNIERAGGWLDTFVAAYETRAWLFLISGALNMSRETLARARLIAVERGVPRLGWYADIWEARLLVFAGLPDEAGSALDRVRTSAGQTDNTNASLAFALRLTDALVRTAKGHGGAAETVVLWEEAIGSESLADRIETAILHAIALAPAAARDATLLFRETLEFSESEGLHSLIVQFGVALAPLIAAAQTHIGLLGPAQRTSVANLATLCAPTTPSPAVAQKQDLSVTPREADVMRLLADGLSSKEIARKLGVAESTIKTHRINVYRKLGVTMRSKAIEKARQRGLIP